MNVDDILNPLGGWGPRQGPCVHCGCEKVYTQQFSSRCVDCHRVPWSPHSRCQCEGAHLPSVEPRAAIASNGVRQIRLWCTLCQLPRGHAISHRACRAHGWDPHTVPVVADRTANHDIATACARCGSTGPVEYHHFAPWSLFDDPDEWPTAFLCPPCHREWHRRTGLANGGKR